jgi:glycopeptide antibiotics resistance protein
LSRSFAAALLTLYLAVLLDLTLVKFPQHDPSPHLTPFETISHDWRAGGEDFVVNFLGNLAAFVPFGALLPLVRTGRTSAGRVVATGAALSAAIELAQYASGRRVADVDDILLNASGALIGYAALRTARALVPRRASAPEPPAG